MPDFAYTARDLAGKQQTGRLSANSEREALAALDAKALYPVKIEVEKQRRTIGGGRVKPQLIATVYAQLADLLRSGVPLLRSLDVLKRQASHAKLKMIMQEVHASVEDGRTLAEAMLQHPKVFGEMAVSMVRAGGEGGFLEEALDRVAEFTEHQQDMKSRTIGAIAYPAVLAGIGTLVVIILLIFFVPMFEPMFDRLRNKGELPVMTDIVLAISDFLQAYWWIPAVLLVGAGIFINRKLETEEGKLLRDKIKFKIPGGGVVFRNMAVSRFCRVLGTLLRNGVPILRSLDISRDSAGNRVLSQAIAKASENITAGESLSGPLAASGHFPPAVTEMIAVAEEANTLDSVLINVAEGLENRTWRQLDLVVRLLEPILLLLMALIVLMLAIALLLPVIRMSSSI
ncbi:MAG: type II secretion system F family protein [Pirellulales bacterium]|nr:type II secretion system F family protein [Pirellulales bacterium]